MALASVLEDMVLSYCYRPDVDVTEEFRLVFGCDPTTFDVCLHADYPGRFVKAFAKEAGREIHIDPKADVSKEFVLAHGTSDSIMVHHTTSNEEAVELSVKRDVFHHLSHSYRKLDPNLIKKYYPDDYAEVITMHADHGDTIDLTEEFVLENLDEFHPLLEELFFSSKLSAALILTFREQIEIKNLGSYPRCRELLADPEILRRFLEVDALHSRSGRYLGPRFFLEHPDQLEEKTIDRYFEDCIERLSAEMIHFLRPYRHRLNSWIVVVANHNVTEEIAHEALIEHKDEITLSPWRYFRNPALSLQFFTDHQHKMSIDYSVLSHRPDLPIPFILEHKDELSIVDLLGSNSNLPQWLGCRALRKELKRLRDARKTGHNKQLTAVGLTQRRSTVNSR